LPEYLAVSHREHRTWVEWLDLQWNKPGRLEWYLMQIAFFIAQSASRERLSIKDFKIPFEFVMPEGAPEDEEKEKELASRQSIAAWFSMLGPQNIRIADAKRERNSEHDRTTDR